MREGKDLEEVREKSARTAATPNSRIAAFFDLDGTLMPLPSLEKRFFRMLHYRREIQLANYFLWLRGAVRLLPRGTRAALQANKIYLRGVRTFGESDAGDRGGCSDSSAHTGGHQAGGQASAAPPKRRNPRLPAPSFFAQAVERVAWHAKRCHAIALITGTLEPLANAAARELEAELENRGLVAKICVCATKLEEAGGKWTGHLAGEAIFGEAKARAVRALAEEKHLDLAQCHAYGDSGDDKWMLEAVGQPAAVNPSQKLARIARKLGWPVLRWKAEKNLTQSAQRTQRRAGNKEEIMSEPVPRQAERCV